MIQYIKRKDLDTAKYDYCIEHSKQSRSYAFSWYLDIVADNWGVLVLDNYKVVMPIPWNKKYGLKYISQPYFCQQLGFFSIDKISEELEAEFLKKIPRIFVKVSLNYNSDNYFNPKMIAKKNYILKLNDTYINLYKSFSKGRKHASKVGEKKTLVIKSTSIFDVIKIQEEFYNYTDYSKEKLVRLSEYILENNKGIVQGVFKDDVLVGGALFLQTKSRITYLFSSFTNEGRKLQASSFLLCNMIKKHENSNIILDFEGGNMANIGSFYKSFGAEIKQYYFFKRTFL
jgi:lipid II:glycine glycyltransferase (peptidoglycan interpeptide bridge formation enzyme)